MTPRERTREIPIDPKRPKDPKRSRDREPQRQRDPENQRERPHCEKQSGERDSDNVKVRSREKAAKEIKSR